MHPRTRTAPEGLDAGGRLGDYVKGTIELRQKPKFESRHPHKRSSEKITSFYAPHFSKNAPSNSVMSKHRFSGLAVFIPTVKIKFLERLAFR